MKDKYIDLIEQSFDFPQDEFSVEDTSCTSTTFRSWN